MAQGNNLQAIHALHEAFPLLGQEIMFEKKIESNYSDLLVSAMETQEEFNLSEKQEEEIIECGRIYALLAEISYFYGDLQYMAYTAAQSIKQYYRIKTRVRINSLLTVYGLCVALTISCANFDLSIRIRDLCLSLYSLVEPS